MALRLRALERDDLRIVHHLNNNRRIMSYWFEEPYESFVELEELYMKHIHDQSERRFIVEDDDVGPAGLVELVEIDQVHRRAEFQIIISPEHQSKGFGQEATLLALDYAFRILNLHKVYLIVAVTNDAAIALYRKCGFQEEGCLKAEFFSDGAYQDALRMYRLQEEFLAGGA